MNRGLRDSQIMPIEPYSRIISYGNLYSGTVGSSSKFYYFFGAIAESRRRAINVTNINVDSPIVPRKQYLPCANSLKHYQDKGGREELHGLQLNRNPRPTARGRLYLPSNSYQTKLGSTRTSVIFQPWLHSRAYLCGGLYWPLFQILPKTLPLVARGGLIQTSLVNATMRKKTFGCMEFCKILSARKWTRRKRLQLQTMKTLVHTVSFCSLASRFFRQEACYKSLAAVRGDVSIRFSTEELLWK